MDIYTILQSIPHNPHFLKRYYNFILGCQKVNEGKELGYTEKHHILPKSLFPDYTNLVINNWNEAILTARQHYLSHWLLWKAYGGLMAIAFHFMVHIESDNGYKRLPSKVYQMLREACNRQLIETSPFLGMVTARHIITGERIFVTKEEFYNDDKLVGHSSGMTRNRSTNPAKDSFSNKPLGAISRDDPRWETGEIVHTNTGQVRTQESRDKVWENRERPLGDKNPAARKIRVNGFEYGSIIGAAKVLNIKVDALREMLKKQRQRSKKHNIWEITYL